MISLGVVGWVLLFVINFFTKLQVRRMKRFLIGTLDLNHVLDFSFDDNKVELKI